MTSGDYTMKLIADGGTEGSVAAAIHDGVGGRWMEEDKTRLFARDILVDAVTWPCIGVVNCKVFLIIIVPRLPTPMSANYTA